MKSIKIYILMIMVLLLIGCGKNEEILCEQGILEDGICKVEELKEANILCPTGYTFNLEKGKCVSTMTIAAKTVNKCSKGYVIGNEKWCISEKKYDMEYNRVCESDRIKEGDTLSSTYIAKSNLCYEKICIEKSEDGKECLKYEEKNIPYKVKKICPEKGMTKWEGYCRKIAWMYIDTSCEVGELVGDKCIIENLTDASINCEEGYTLTSDYKCQKITYHEPIKKAE